MAASLLSAELSTTYSQICWGQLSWCHLHHTSWVISSHAWCSSVLIEMLLEVYFFYHFACPSFILSVLHMLQQLALTYSSCQKSFVTSQPQHQYELLLYIAGIPVNCRILSICEDKRGDKKLYKVRFLFWLAVESV